jgi:hypothetical protein
MNDLFENVFDINDRCQRWDHFDTLYDRFYKPKFNEDGSLVNKVHYWHRLARWEYMKGFRIKPEHMAFRPKLPR